ncbi:MAG: methionyl-tRNA formyltransferase [Gammaproteobacteria bacterium]|nr:methionyl-tRNA formyltransferase [Gammaproteobacteria bacterium]
MTKTTSLNIIFAGTPDFAAVSLQALLDSPHHVKAVYTQPDRPAGRGRKLTASPVKELALQHHLSIHQPQTLRDEHEQKKLADIHADVMVVVAYGLILPLPILNAPRLGCINVHGSLLPRWRGAAPIQRAILAGDKVTGVTIMQLNEGLDTGPMLHKLECAIQADDTSASLYERLAELGAQGLLTTLTQLAQGIAKPEIQNNALATHAAKITKEEAQLNWQCSAEELSRCVRGFNPWPIAHTKVDDQTLRVWQAQVIENNNSLEPGKILQVSAEGIDVATGKGILRLQKLQLPGGRVVNASDLLNAQHCLFTINKKLG